MLTPDEFSKWCSDQNLSELSRKTLAYIRSVEPARRVGGGRKNVSGFYPSKKMGKTIQFESHKVELPFIYELEHDEEVLEFYDQPPAFKINYQSSNGRNLGFFYTPDFFVIRTNSAGWVECKTETELQKLVVKQPHRYTRGEDGQWYTPPASEYATQFGFDFQIFSNAQINWVLYRNITFLEDYYRQKDHLQNDWSTDDIEQIVRSQPGITLNQLLGHTSGVSADLIYLLIASEHLYVDLRSNLLVESEKCQVFCNQKSANAYRMMVSSRAATDSICSPVVNLVPNTQISWDGKIYTLIQIGKIEITLRADSGEFIDLPLKIIVTDNGKEFHSTYFESLLALFECTLKHRPPAASRFGGVCERLFGTANTQFLYNLAGNTQITKKVRLMTSAVNPKNSSVWTLGLLYLYLCEWAYSEYDTTEHPALGMCPQKAFTQGIAKHGSRSHRLIPNDENWKILTLPTTQSQKVKVHATQGIQIRGIHYWNSGFRDPNIHKTYVEIRYDPFDVGIAYAYVRGQWVKCVSEYYAIFKGRSEKEIWLATAELQKRKSNHQKQLKIKAKKLAEFLSTAEAEEVLLAQRLRDAQGREVFNVIDSGQNKESFLEPSNLTEIVAVIEEDQHLESFTDEDMSAQKPPVLQLFGSY